MNDPPSDVNENIIDIFVLSVSETVTSLFTEHLEKKGYRVTLFTDGRYLLQTLREGKPNLLICDTSTLDEEGFEVCRLIKADNDLWVIPVLILAKGSSLTDLLRVLDCNADNFITHPFDPAYGLSVIDGLLSTPVERQTPEQIKTQFKISHNDQIYVVAANRRKLLEFLLSSFEITVNQSSELFRIKSEFRMLSESAKNLEDRVREQTRVIDGIRDTLRQKEQKILSLTHQSEEDKKILAHNTEVIEHFSEQLEDDKVLLTTLEKNLRESISQREEIQSTLQSEINTLRRQISELSTEIDQTKTTLDTVQGELDDERIHCTSLECTIDLQIQQKELAEKSLQTLTSEYEQLKSALADEESRAVSAETELEKVREEKTRAEDEFTKKISSLTEEIQRQTADLNRIQRELEGETNQRTGLENTLELLQKEKDRSESSLQSSVSGLTQQLGDLQVQYDRISAMLESEQASTESLRKNLDEVIAEKEKTSTALTTENDDLKSALDDERIRASSAEQELQKIVHEKTQAEQQLARRIEDLNATIQEQTADLERLQTGLDEEGKKRISAENLAGAVKQEKEQAEQQLARRIEDLNATIQEQAANMERLQAGLDEEGKKRISAENLAGAVKQEKEQAEQQLARRIEDLNATIQEQTADLERLQAGLDEEEKKRISAENLAGAVRQEKDQAEQALARRIEDLNATIQEQTANLERLQTGLDEEEKKRISAENLAGAVRQEKEQAEQQLARRIEDLNATIQEQSAELANLKAGLDEEGQKRISAENLAGAVRQEKEQAEQALARRIEDLNATIEEQTAELANLKAGLDEEGQKRISAENLAGAVRQEKEQAESSLGAELAALKGQVAELQDKFDLARTALSTEENRTKSLKEHIAGIVAEKEKAEEMLKTDRESYKSTFLRLKHDLDEATAIPVTLEKELIAAKSQNKALTDELNLAYQAKSQTSQQMHSLMEELEQAKAELESEKDQHLKRSESHDAIRQNAERLEQELRTVSDERASLKEMIENERRLRLAAEEKTKQAADKQQLLEQELSAMSSGRAQQETERSKKIQNLEKDFELVAELQKSLENQVNNLKTEKAQAEATIQALTRELDQARTALADEWEDHMISVAAAFKERQRLQQGFTQGGAHEVPKEKSTETTPSMADLPLDADSVPQSPMKGLESETRVRRVPEKEPCSDEPETTVSEVSPRVVTDIVNIFSDDDLFETDEPASPPQNKALEPVNSTEPLPDRSFTEIPDEFSESDEEGGEAVSSGEDLSGGGENIQDAVISAEDSVTPLSHGVFSFNRRQWLDLVKWARHSQNLSHDQRIQIVRMGRLIQKGRKLTKKQEEQINEMIALVQAMGYHPS